MGTIIFNGRSSADIPIVVERPPDYAYPERDYSTEHIPGRSGDLVYDNGAFKNVDRTYEIAAGVFDSDFASVANKIVSWLSSVDGYARLEDSYEPEYFRLAMYKEKNAFVNIYNKGGRTTITFNCKPQRFLKSGEQILSITQPCDIFNPTAFKARPLITVYGSGPCALNVDGVIVEIKQLEDQITLDCEILDAYRQVGDAAQQNKNNTIYAMEFPVLNAGPSHISWTGNIAKVEIIPRWWTV